MQVNGEEQAPQAAETAGAELHADLDALELEAARKAVEAEEAGAAGGGQSEPAAQPKDGNGADGKPPAISPVMIPKQRFDEVSQARRHYESEAQRLARENAELVAKLAEAKGPVVPVEQRRSTLEGQIDVLAKRFDEGEIPYAELKKQERELNRQLETLREEEILSRVPKPEAPAAAPRDTLALDTATIELEQRYPYVVALSQDQLQWLGGLAVQQLGDGFINDGSDRASLAIRTKIAELSEDYGPVMLKGNDPVSEARKAPGAPASPKAPLSPEAAARQAKGELSAGFPATLDTVTSGGGGAGELTEESIAMMSEQELENLPAATRRRYLGV